MLILFLILIVLALVILIANIAIVPQAYSYVVERLGVYYTTWEAGFHFKTPFVTRIAKKVSLKEQVVDFKPQPVITRDNVTMQIDTVVVLPDHRPERLFTLRRGGARLSAIENLSATTAAQHHRRHGSGADPHQPRHHQLPDARPAGRGHRPLGHQGQPGRGQEHSAPPTYRAPWRSR